MGFDITFHPVSIEIEGKLIRDLFLYKKEPDNVIACLPNVKDDFLGPLAETLKNLREALDTEKYFASIVSYCVCMLAGFFRPYWYARGQAISFYLEKGHEPSEVFTPVLDWLGEPFCGKNDPSRGLIFGNYTGSGVIADPKHFQEWFNSQTPGDHFDESGAESIQ